MPELPEVETTRRGIAPHILNHRIQDVVVRQARLRWPVPERELKQITGTTVTAVERRAKYLLLGTPIGTLIIHLGMSGSLRILPGDTPPQKHDHLDIVLDNGQCLRLTDPRRFGAVLWTDQPPTEHPLLRELGPEPFDSNFDGDYLYRLSRGRKVSIKQFLMDGGVVVGVGNIYANEALFLAGLRPSRAASLISRPRYEQLAAIIKQVLQAAIAQGGTTLRDFVGGDGKPGYFAQQLRVYGRTGEACPQCGSAIKETRIGQRSTFYCPACQR